ncbi:phage tail assembly chaperone [Pseudomonas monteilii]|uniref:phage tail assembly chaperone n=1 Tax=Pseudomonas monteilii TaxID=76759 RepID=UPI001F47DF59|nr:phage tail assembly chaperone [Pseudomonas monteilii]
MSQYAIVNQDLQVLYISESKSDKFRSVEVTDVEAENMRAGIMNQFNYVLVEPEMAFNRVIKKKAVDWSIVRSKRDSLLKAADNYEKILNDKQILGDDITSMRIKLAQYRESLRNCPESYDSPQNVKYPDNSFMLS